MTVVIIVVVVILLAAAAAGGYVIAQRKKSQELQEEFGPEYDRVLEQSDSKQDAEKELAERKKQHDKLDLRPLDDQTRERFRGEWQRVQGSFVDDPGEAVGQADSLVISIMRERNYPVDDFEQRADVISVDHPRVVEHYREARRVHDAHRDGSADTEELRGAVTAYRNLVEALLDDDGSSSSHGTANEPDGAGQAGAASSGTASNGEARS